MNDAELASKFYVLSSGRLKREQREQAVQMIDELEKLPAIATLMKLVS